MSIVEAVIAAAVEVGWAVQEIVSGGGPVPTYKKQTPSEYSFLQQKITNVGPLEKPSETYRRNTGLLWSGGLCSMCISCCVSMMMMMMLMGMSGAS